jgi:NAD(P)-dependent dehydrogenase (short-subunit alcohol dehydrogenase family)
MYKLQVPLRSLGHPEDLAGMVVFLASPGAGYITGQTYAVDGGYTMQ